MPRFVTKLPQVALVPGIPVRADFPPRAADHVLAHRALEQHAHRALEQHAQRALDPARVGLCEIGARDQRLDLARHAA